MTPLAEATKKIQIIRALELGDLGLSVVTPCSHLNMFFLLDINIGT